MRRFLLGLAAALMPFSGCFLEQPEVMCDCMSPGLVLSLPCDRAVATLGEVELLGACQGAKLSLGPQVWVHPTRAGECRIVLHFSGGETFIHDATLVYSDGCCAGYHAMDSSKQYVEVPAEGICDAPSDAGIPASGSCEGKPAPAGCFTVPEFDDCNCRCPGLDVAAMGHVNGSRPQCTRACSCGLGTVDLTSGCKSDGDCQLVPADCCGCQSYGASTAVLKTHAAAWEADMSAHCDLVAMGGCSTAFMCGHVRAICKQGRCVVAAATDAGQ